MKRNQEYFRGCLLGGAIGDALGWPVEFMVLKEIRRKYGEDGIRNLICNRFGKAEITDDTQMTLFTAEGILRAETRGSIRGICNPPSVVYYAYQRWLITQRYTRFEEFERIYDGWLIEIPELHEKRAPGNSCISALLSRKKGKIGKPINNSKGCGGVMRVAPTGLFYPRETAFKMAAEFAAITHGHPSGYLSAGTLSFIIASIIEGKDLKIAVEEALLELKKYEDHQECFQKLKKAVDLSFDDIHHIDAIRELGEGWVGEETLAISVYCALKYKDDFKKALITAVNHDGDSDSTGAITGNILGAYLGVNNIPKEWIDKVELAEVIFQIADDLLIGYQDNDEWLRRYPAH